MLPLAISETKQKLQKSLGNTKYIIKIMVCNNIL